MAFEQLQIRIDAELDAAVRASAAKLGESLTAWVTTALIDRLQSLHDDERVPVQVTDARFAREKGIETK